MCTDLSWNVCKSDCQKQSTLSRQANGVTAIFFLPWNYRQATKNPGSHTLQDWHWLL